MRLSFLILAVTDWLLMAVTVSLGLFVGGALGTSLQSDGLVVRHFLLALGTMLFTCFVHVLTFTYFVVFSRMAKEAAEHARQRPADYVIVADLKRRAARWLLLGVGSVILAGATGPLVAGAGSTSLIWHMCLGLAALAANTIAFAAEYALIRRNTQLTDELYGPGADLAAAQPPAGAKAP